MGAKKQFKRLLLGALGCALTACHTSGPLAPLEINGRVYQEKCFTPSPRHKKTKRAAIKDSNTILVNPQDTLYRIARRHRIPLRTLIEHNNLQPPYLVQPGQTLKKPRPKTYTIKKGDTLYNIARRYGLSRHQLAHLNKITNPAALSPGMVLQLPASQSTFKRHRPKITSRPTKAITKKRVLLKSPPKRSGRGKFLQPVQGRIISKYGYMRGGLQNDGINIQAPSGTPIKASENGVVAYVGDSIASFGTLILIKHAQGWVSAYGHVARPKVKPGDVIKRGQPIATVGTTGHVKTPQLHFELRKGSKTRDPLKYISVK